jgi:RNA polymerase sigma-70 factor (ECF subfamily)
MAKVQWEKVREVASDHELGASIRIGNFLAFESIFRSYYAPLCRFAFRFLGSTAESEDVVQDIFVKLWVNQADWRPAGTVRSYLYRAVKNQALNCLRHQKIANIQRGDSFATHLIDTRSLEEELHQQELRAALAQAIELLPPQCRMVFLLQRDDNLTYSEIAEVCNISVKTVETHIGRALKSLRKHLSPYLAEQT